MADNVAITAGSGTNIATDEITGTGEHAQVVKLAIATDGSRTLIPADATNGIDVDVTRVVPGTGATELGKAEDAAHTTGDVGVLMLGIRNDAHATRTNADGDYTAIAVDAEGCVLVRGNVAHDATDSDGPVKVGHVAIAHGTNPTAVAAADRTNWYANRAGVPFVIGGHPNVITRAVYIADATGAQTDASIVGTIAAGTKVVVTAVTVTCDGGNTGDVAVKLGFGASTLPADSSTGAAGILLDHKGIKPGSGIVVGNGGGILGVGADGEELRLTCEDPVGGSVSVQFSYYTIES